MRSVKRSTRIDLVRPAVLLNSDGATLEVTILDLSSGGFRVQVSDLLRVGELVTLQEGRHQMSAEIKWVLGNEAGGVFLDRPF